MNTHIQKTINDYLDAVAQSFGETYRDAMVVEQRGMDILIRHPGSTEGELLPLGYMPILTRNTRSGWFRKHAA